MELAVRLWTEADGYERLAEIASQNSLEPVTPESLQDGDRRLSPDAFFRRWLAVGAGGTVLGFGAARRLPYEEAGVFTVRAVVDRCFRGAGVGDALARQAESEAREAGAHAFRAFIRDDDPGTLGFAQHRGYAIDKHWFESLLPVADARDAEFEAAIPRLEAEGVRFFTFADQPGEATERALYELDRATSADNPGEDLPDFLPLDEWRKHTVGAPLFRPDLLWIAAHGDRLIGLTELKVQRGAAGLITGFTGVLREYRGRGIAMTLKIHAVRTARRLGAPYIRTNNDARNGPMLAINRKLGFVQEPGMYVLRKSV
ncbi:MAG TPA: GNAT family N-acetyltransferase [Symbiobacteriaceae bacterium]|jgi:GNAT superfamily N-acetyltransferase|nr:GNAT family N-acetyltransferase [Symbiobacteriaceae bacterium]